jgi:hypothetical protein
MILPCKGRWRAKQDGGVASGHRGANNAASPLQKRVAILTQVTVRRAHVRVARQE